MAEENALVVADVDVDAVLDVLRRSTETLAAAGVPYVLIGGLAATIWGPERFTADVDLMVKREDADRAFDALEQAGFAPDLKNPQWIYKLREGDVDLDVIFWLKGNIELDDEMLERARPAELRGVAVTAMAPEDLLVVKAIAHDDQTPRHWHDALGLIAAQRDLDWDYVVRRAHSGARRVLSLMIFAQSNDLVVPTSAIRSLYEELYGDG